MEEQTILGVALRRGRWYNAKEQMKKKNSLPRALIDPNKEADMLDMAKKLGSLPRDLQMYVAGAIDMAATMPGVKSDDTGQKQKTT